VVPELYEAPSRQQADASSDHDVCALRTALCRVRPEYPEASGRCAPTLNGNRGKSSSLCTQGRPAQGVTAATNAPS
jgi:hypothetical protein